MEQNPFGAFHGAFRHQPYWLRRIVPTLSAGEEIFEGGGDENEKTH
jgi:hypothetical protein